MVSEPEVGYRAAHEPPCTPPPASAPPPPQRFSKVRPYQLEGTVARSLSPERSRGTRLFRVWGGGVRARGAGFSLSPVTIEVGERAGDGLEGAHGAVVRVGVHVLLLEEACHESRSL